MLEFKVGMGKINKCVSWSGGRGAELIKEKKPGWSFLCMYLCHQHNFVCVFRGGEGVCLHVYTVCVWKIESRGWRGKPFYFKYDQLPWKYLPNIFLLPSKIDLFHCKDCSKDLMENKFRSIWNSWVDLPGLHSVSPCLFVFQLQEGSGLCWLRRYLVCLLLQISWRGSYCRWSEIGQT